MQEITLEQELYPLLVGITDDLLFLLHLFWMFTFWQLWRVCEKQKNIFLAIKHAMNLSQLSDISFTLDNCLFKTDWSYRVLNNNYTEPNWETFDVLPGSSLAIVSDVKLKAINSPIGYLKLIRKKYQITSHGRSVKVVL